MNDISTPAECEILNAGDITIIRTHDQIQMLHNGAPVDLPTAKKINPSVANVVSWFVGQRNKLSGDRKRARLQADNERKRIRMEANSEYTAGLSSLQSGLNVRLAATA